MSGLEINIAKGDIHFEVENGKLIFYVKKQSLQQLSASELSPYYLGAIKIKIDALKRAEQDLLPHPSQWHTDNMLRCRLIVDAAFDEAQNLLSANHPWTDPDVQVAVNKLKDAIVEYESAIGKAKTAYHLSQISVSESTLSVNILQSIVTSFRNQLRVLKAKADVLVPLLPLQAVRILDNAYIEAQLAIDDYEAFAKIGKDKAKELEEACRSSLAFYEKAISILHKNTIHKVSKEELASIGIIAIEDQENVLAIAYANAAQQHAFNMSQLHLSQATMSIDTAITHTQNLSIFLRSSDGTLLKNEPTTKLSIGVRFNGKDITDEVLVMEHPVNFVWHRQSKDGVHDGMTDAEWGAYAMGRHEIVIKKAEKDKLKFWVETTPDEDKRIVEQFKYKRV